MFKTQFPSFFASASASNASSPIQPVAKNEESDKKRLDAQILSTINPSAMQPQLAYNGDHKDSGSSSIATGFIG